MVKIDGSKVRQLRESQGLTQLYMATAVEVTTDTISRWENRRYPTIKKENGLKLAEALGVELSEILEVEEEPIEVVAGKEPPPNSVAPPPSPVNRARLPVALLLLTVLAAMAAWWFTAKSVPGISARRILPLAVITNQPFPVLIEVTAESDESVSLILKETLPPDARILTTLPKLSPSNVKDHRIKWLKKISGKMLFAYMVQMPAGPGETRRFSGTVATSRSASGTIAVTGDSQIRFGNAHWADSDANGVISDQEILAVYDRYGGVEELGLDIDMVEEMWLGSGYQWNTTTKNFVITP